MLAAEVLGRGLGWGALGPGEAPSHSVDSHRVALTFDDGPSEYTGALLEVLARHGAKATFFVTQASCRAFPAQLELMRHSGHQLEAHGRWHTHALLLWPWREWAQIRWHPRTGGAGRGGAGPYLYRPPYGGHSPLTRLFAALNHRHVALWDIESRDWTPENPALLAARTAQQLHGGGIVLLHDQFAVTPDLLERLLSLPASQRFSFVTLNDLPPQRITFWAGLKRLRGSYGGPT